MKARHQFLQQHKKYDQFVPELAQYHNLTNLSNLFAFIIVAGVAIKFSKYQLAKNKIYNVTLFSLLPIAGLIGHLQDEQSKKAEIALHQYIQNEFQQKE